MVIQKSKRSSPVAHLGLHGVSLLGDSEKRLNRDRDCDLQSAGRFIYVAR